MKHLDLTERGAWERARILAYVTAQTHSSEKLTPADVMPLPWDKDREEEPERPATKEEIDSLRRYADEIAKQL